MTTAKKITPPPTATKPAPKARAKKKGLDLTPDMTSARAVAVRTRMAAWVGALPNCPAEHIDLCGVMFPKLNERIVPDPMRNGEKRRVPVIGGLVRINEAKVQALRARLAHTVIRFTDSKPMEQEPGTGLNVGDVHQRPRRGHLITIPTEEEILEARKVGRAINIYVPREGDEPAARYLFLHWCDNQERGNRGDFYPDPLETTGLEWPSDE